MNLQSYIKDIRKDGRRCFTKLEIVEQFHVSNSHARVALHRLLKTGDLISPARGLYVIVISNRRIKYPSTFGDVEYDTLILGDRELNLA